MGSRFSAVRGERGCVLFSPSRAVVTREDTESWLGVGVGNTVVVEVIVERLTSTCSWPSMGLGGTVGECAPSGT
jgi:hypothetical protein